ncbi:hypothetical protein D9757_008225 [Collybiopsis confluens]|uniref:Uncharacterized protein n=1 Tax=Collybiopsis confluens TaxID=2823264 RepID=A0A8H5HBP0_9AGAR|nr:hypothetical protein D9757_008225 [Collybiopsis confluens]
MFQNSAISLQSTLLRGLRRVTRTWAPTPQPASIFGHLIGTYPLSPHIHNENRNVCSSTVITAESVSVGDNKENPGLYNFNRPGSNSKRRRLGSQSDSGGTPTGSLLSPLSSLSSFPANPSTSFTPTHASRTDRKRKHASLPLEHRLQLVIQFSKEHGLNLDRLVYELFCLLTTAEKETREEEDKSASRSRSANGVEFLRGDSSVCVANILFFLQVAFSAMD